MTKRLALAIGLVLGIVAVLYAANLTLTLTAEQVSVIQWKWNAVDPEHREFPTAQAFAAKAFEREIDEWRNQKALADRSSFCEKFRKGTQQQKDNACSAIDEPAGCDPCK